MAFNPKTKLNTLSLLLLSTIFFAGCEDSVKTDNTLEDKGTAPEITAISAKKSDYEVSSEITSTVTATINFTVKDVDKDFSKMRIIFAGQPQDLTLDEAFGLAEVEAGMTIQLPVGEVADYPTYFIAIDSKGNLSDTSSITFTISEAVVTPND